MMKKNTVFSPPSFTSPLVLLAGGDYWHAGFPGLDKQDRGRDDGALAHDHAHDYFDKTRPDGFVIHQGLLIHGVKPLHHRAMIRLTAPADEARPDKFLMGLLAKAGAPTKISGISQGVYYQSSLAVKKSGIIAMRFSETEAMVYHSHYKPSDKKLPSPFLQPAGAGWQLVRVSGNKKLRPFLSNFIALPDHHAKPKDDHNFYCLSVLNVSIYLFHDGDEALFFIPRSVASSMLCHLANVAAATTDNLTRVTIDH